MFKGNVIQPRKIIVLKSMPFWALSFEDDARISIYPSKALIEFPWEALQESCTITAPDLAVVIDQPSLQTSRVSPLIFAHTDSALTWFDNNNYAIFYPHLW